MGAKSFDAATWSKVRVSCPARSAFLLFRDTSRPPGHRERGRACVREGDRPAPARWAAELRTCPELLWLQGDSKMATVPLLANAPGPRGALWVHKGSICVQESKAVAEFILPDLEELPTKTLLRCRKPAFTSSWPSSPGKMREVLAADFPGAGPPGDGAVAGGRPNSLRSIAKGRMLGDARFGTMCRQCCCNLARCGAGMLGLGLSPITPLVPGDCVRWWPPVAQKGRERHPWMGADDEPRAQLRATHAAALAKARAGGGARQPSLLTRQRVGEKINRGPTVPKSPLSRSLALRSSQLSAQDSVVRGDVEGPLEGSGTSARSPRAAAGVRKPRDSVRRPALRRAAPRCAALSMRPSGSRGPFRSASLWSFGRGPAGGALCWRRLERSQVQELFQVAPRRGRWPRGTRPELFGDAVPQCERRPPRHSSAITRRPPTRSAISFLSWLRSPGGACLRPRSRGRRRGVQGQPEGAVPALKRPGLLPQAALPQGKPGAQNAGTKRRPGALGWAKPCTLTLRGCSLKRESQVLWRSIGVRHVAGSAPGFPTQPL